MEYPGHLRVPLAGVEHFVGGGIAALAVERIEQVHPVIEDTYGAEADAPRLLSRHRVQGKGPRDRLGPNHVRIVVVNEGRIGWANGERTGRVVDRKIVAHDDAVVTAHRDGEAGLRPRGRSLDGGLRQ